MRKRTVVFLFVVALVGTVIFGWMTIRRGVKRAGQSFSIGNLYREDRAQPDTSQ